MKLTEGQNHTLLRAHGIWITEACDKCGRLLGAVRWTRSGESGEWCSEACRDGIKVATSEVSSRRRARRMRLVSATPPPTSTNNRLNAFSQAVENLDRTFAAIGPCVRATLHAVRV